MARYRTTNLNRGMARRRRSLGITQHQLAKDSGVSVGRISYAETGRLELTPDELDSIQAVIKKRGQEIVEEVFA